MKKLTDDWKIKKRKSTSCGFKESIDFKLTTPERNQSTPVKRGLFATPKQKSLSKELNVLKHVETGQGRGTLHRSTRLSNKCSGTKEIHSKSVLQGGVKPFLFESVAEVSNESDICDQKHEKSRIEDDGCNLSQWGLPPSVVQAYNSKNINNMFQWQYECLLMKDVLDGGNLVFSAPTSAGKTLVAEILMLKSVTETKKKAIMILPFVSVVREKVHYFQEMFENAGIVVDGYMGAHNPPGGFKSVDIAICTMEKANNLVNRLMEERRLGEVGILVVDELHMLGDHGRGYLLELLLTKLLYNCKKNNVHIQIVGMSATLPNLDVLAYWLDSQLYHTDFRPVPLHELVKVGNVIYDAKSKTSSRDLNQVGVTFSDDVDHTIFLSIETITKGHGVLIFCPSKNWCENLATNIAKEIYNAGRPRDVANGNTAYNAIGEKLREHLNGSQLNDIIQQLKSSPAGLDSVLGLTVPFGVAFHHAGLTFDERDVIEGAFRQGILKILVATSTLSSGVNLPARRVIIRSPLFCGSVIDVLSYKQMVGRAGRKGIDDEGESILICKESERNVALTLISSELRPVKSCLLKSGTNSLHSSLKRALIEVIASGVASTQKEVLQYVTCTLLHASLAKESESSNNDVESSIEKCIEYLVDNDIIFKHEETDNEEYIEVTYKPSRLGLAILASGFSPDDALRVLKELQLARRCFVLENDLHILYEVTPPYLSEQMGSLNWMHFLSLWEDLPEEYRRVGELVGVQESFIGLGIQGRLSRAHHPTLHKMAVHQRFYATLALNDLIQEVPLPLVAKKYDCTRGVLQSLQQSTSTFAGMLTTFCNRLGWHNLELLFSSFQKRVHFGIQQELCDLVRLSTLNAQRARALYNAGFESVASLASASAEELALLLINMGSFESAKQLDGALAEEALKRHEAKRIRITGKAGVNEREAAQLIIQEAQNFIQLELGISGIHWKHKAARKFEKTSESNIANPSTSSVIGTNPQSKCDQTAAANESMQNGPIPSQSPTIENIKSKHDASSKESRATNRKGNVSEKSDEVPDLENYPEILRKIYTEDCGIEAKCGVSLGLSVGKVSEKLSKELLSDTIHETRGVDIKESDVFSESIFHESAGCLHEPCIFHEEADVFSESIFHESVHEVFCSNKNAVEERDKIFSLKPVNQTVLLVEDLKETVDSANDTKNEAITMINQSFYSNFDEKFCSFEETQKSCSKLEIEKSVESLKEAVDDVSFNELILSQTANGDYVYFSESFNVCPNQNSNIQNGNNSVLPAAIEHTTEATDCVLSCHNNDMDLQCLINAKERANKCSFLDVSELNFMSESCFSFELGNSLKCTDYYPEKVSTLVNEIKPKTEQPLFVSNSASKNFNQELVKLSHFKEKSSLNAHSTPVKLLSKDSFSVVRHSEILLPVISKSDTSVNNLRTSLPKVKILHESSFECEKGNSINETSGDIFESDESFNADCVGSNKANIKDLSNSKINDSFHAALIKLENLAAETSGDIFEDSFNDCKVQLEVKANKHLNQNIPANEKVKDTFQRNKFHVDTKQIENISEKDYNPDRIPYSDALNHESHRKEEFADILNGSKTIGDIKTEIKVFNTSLEEDDVPLLNTKDQSQFWNSWNPSQESLLTPQPAQKSKNKANIKCLIDIPIEKTTKLNEDGDLTLDSVDNSLFNSFNSDCLSPTPDKSTKSLKIQVSSHRISSGFLAIPKSKELPRRTCKNKGLVNKENISPNNKENTNSQHSRVDSQITLKISEISDTELEAFLKRTAKVKKFALSVACEKVLTKNHTIGPSKNTKSSMARKHQWVVDPDISIVGLVICYGKDSFYISCSEEEFKNNLSTLTFLEKSKLIQKFFNKNIAGSCVVANDTKSQYKILWRGCNIPLKQKCVDPSIAAWLLDPAKGQQPLKMLVNNFWPEATYLMEDFDYTSGSLGLQHWNTISGKQRASTEAFISFHLMEKLLAALKEQKLSKAFNEIEMPSVLSFAKMEQNGLGFNTSLAISYQKELQKRQQDILDKAYQVAGRRFNILSSREVSTILFKELKLSPVLAPDSPLISKHLGAGRSTRNRRMPPELKTNKECLQKIIHLHPLPKAILDWRRLSFATTNVLMPLLREHKHNPYFNMDRLYSNCYYYTLTGRVNVHSPNLQFVPRDFNIDNATDVKDNVDDVVDEVHHCSDEDVLQYGVSIRNLFIPSKGNVLLAADYSQLELRILAHLSNEKKLLESLNSNEDVFKNIAAKWKNIPIVYVSNEQRQQAKKICYGMIYGMSASSLSQQLNTTKDEAHAFMETFKKSYPGLHKYFQTVIADCQEKGYVTTLMQRRRYLPMIKSQDKAKQAHAGRQAINTTIQGSAADIIKASMIRIEKELQQMFPETSEPCSSFKSSNTKAKIFRGGFLVLQMHDELIYEVCRGDLQVVLGVIREAMEKTTRLTVKLPVQVRFGTSWGCMTEMS